MSRNVSAPIRPGLRPWPRAQTLAAVASLATFLSFFITGTYSVHSHHQAVTTPICSISAIIHCGHYWISPTCGSQYTSSSRFGCIRSCARTVG